MKSSSSFRVILALLAIAAVTAVLSTNANAGSRGPRVVIVVNAPPTPAPAVSNL